MKKMQYIQPQTEVDLMLPDTQLLTASNTINGDADDVILNPETMEGGDGSNAASRRAVWDDEDEF